MTEVLDRRIVENLRGLRGDLGRRKCCSREKGTAGAVGRKALEPLCSAISLVLPLLYSTAIMTTDTHRMIAALRLGCKARSHKDIDCMAAYLDRIPYFHLKSAELSVEFLRQCSRSMVLAEVPKGEFLYQTGDTSVAMYVLIRGKIAVNEQEIAPGACFGETSVALSQDRDDSARALESSALAVLYKTEFFDIVSDFDSKRFSELMGFLHGLPTFARMSRGAILRISGYFRLVVYSRKQTVYRASDLPSTAYLVKEGEFALVQEVKVRKPHSKLSDRESYRGSMERKREVVVVLVGPGEFLGEVDIVQNRTRLQSCICNSMQGSVLAISRLVLWIDRTSSRYLKGKIPGWISSHALWPKASRMLLE